MNKSIPSLHVALFSPCKLQTYIYIVYPQCGKNKQASGASDQFGETFPVEEVFKQAACEIMCWVSS
jgi:hypothetical protein